MLSFHCQLLRVWAACWRTPSPNVGKIYVENERARLTHRLAKIHEEDGKLQEAATIMQELQVETYGSMERKEKVRGRSFRFGLTSARFWAERKF